MHPSTNQRGECLETATAISLRFAALDQHQMKADAARGNTRRGSRRLTPAVVRCVDDMQDRLAPCKAGFDLLVTGRGRRGSGPFSRIQIPSLNAGFSPSEGQLRVRAFDGCAALFHSRTFDGCRRHLVQSLTHEQAIQAVAHVSHHQDLSKFVASSGSQTSQTGFADAERSFAPGAKEND